MKTKLEEFRWLAALGEKIRSGQASAYEKKEFIEYLYAQGKIDQEQFDNYCSGKYAESILNAGLNIGAIFLVIRFFELVLQKNEALLLEP
jgi:hypothetical protein